MIVTGINEKPLVVEKSSQILCNPYSRCIIHNMQKNIQVHVKNNAEVFFVNMQPGKKKGIVEKNAKLHWIDFFGKNAEAYTLTELQGVQSHATHTMLFIGNREQLISEIRHNAKKTTSDIISFGIVSHAHAFTKAITTIHKNARESIAHQKMKTVLMDEHASASAVPHMNIENNDIQATHNASVGHISKEVLFYMTTRGMDEETAQQQIIAGYFREIIQKFHEDIQKILQKELEKRGEHYA